MIKKPIIFSSNIHKDHRGHFTETYVKKNKNFKNLKFVQDNMSYSKKGVLRGLHYQLNKPQTKFLTVIHGDIFDVVLDLRTKSKNFGKAFYFNMSAKNNNQLLIPIGFAHGFQCVSKTAIVYYKCDDYYYENDQHGIRYDDLSLGIKWPIPKKIISKKDRALSNFDPSLKYF